MIAECARPSSEGAAEDLDWIAEGSEQLGFYLEPVPCTGASPPSEAIALFFSRLDEARTRAAAERRPATPARWSLPAVGDQRGGAARPRRPPRAAAPAAASPAGSRRARRRSPRSDRAAATSELLGIFLDEAGMVLATSTARCEVLRAARRPRGADDDTARLPHAEGQRPHGGADGPRRGRLGSRAGPEPAGWSRSGPATPELIELIERGERVVRRLDRAAAGGKPARSTPAQIVELARRVEATRKSPAAPRGSATAGRSPRRRRLAGRGARPRAGDRTR